MKPVLVCALGLCLQGCYAELMVYKAPEASGRIADAGTNVPIAGACVQVVDNPEARACTDADGKFHLPVILKQERHFVIGPFEPAAPPGVARVSAAGYRSQTLQLHWAINAGLDIRMERGD